MKRRTYIWLCVPLLLLMLLTACHAHFGVEIAMYGLPEGTEPIVLVPEETVDVSRWSIPDGTGTPWKYLCRDGWMSAEGIPDVSCIWIAGLDPPEMRVVLGSGSRDEATRLCETYRTVRLAAMDETGQIAAISTPILLAPEHAGYVVRRLDYNWSDDSYTVTDTWELLWHGKTPTEWWLLTATAAQIGGMIMLALLIVNLISRKTANSSLYEWLLLGVFSVPYLVMDVFYVLLHYSPRFSWQPDGFDQSDIMVLIIFNLLWAAAAVFVIIHQVILHEKRKHANESSVHF